MLLILYIIHGKFSEYPHRAFQFNYLIFYCGFLEITIFLFVHLFLAILTSWICLDDEEDKTVGSKVAVAAESRSHVDREQLSWNHLLHTSHTTKS